MSARPCNPQTLGPPCAGTCRRRLHPRPPKYQSRAACDLGHPVVDSVGRCATCATAHREANPDPTRRRSTGRRLTLLSACPHDEGEHCDCLPGMFAIGGRTASPAPVR